MISPVKKWGAANVFSCLLQARGKFAASLQQAHSDQNSFAANALACEKTVNIFRRVANKHLQACNEYLQLVNGRLQACDRYLQPVVLILQPVIIICSL